MKAGKNHSRARTSSRSHSKRRRNRSRTLRAEHLESRQLLATVAEWTFNEGTGLVAQDSVGTNDGTLINGPLRTTGLLDGALQFDGVDDYVEIPDSADFNVGTAMSMEAWVNFGAIDNEYRIVLWKPDTAATSGADFALIRARSDGTGASFMGKIYSRIETSNGVSDVTSSVIPTPGEWYHVVATYDGASHKLYINGQLEASAAASGSVLFASTPLWIGRNSDLQFNGLVDDVDGILDWLGFGTA